MLPNNIMEIIIATVGTLTKYSEHRSCIISTAVLIDAIDEIVPNSGIYPLTVEATVINQKQYEQVLSQQKITGDLRVIGLRSEKSDEKRWAGHLVAVFPVSENEWYIFDITIPQASSAKENIRLPPVFARVPKSFIKNLDAAGITINDHHVLYKPHPEEVSYEESPLWTEKNYRRTIMEQVLLNLKK